MFQHTCTHDAFVFAHLPVGPMKGEEKEENEE
jgi:hypothetical protein